MYLILCTKYNKNRSQILSHPVRWQAYQPIIPFHHRFFFYVLRILSKKVFFVCVSKRIKKLFITRLKPHYIWILKFHKFYSANEGKWISYQTTATKNEKKRKKNEDDNIKLKPLHPWVFVCMCVCIYIIYSASAYSYDDDDSNQHTNTLF